MRRSCSKALSKVNRKSDIWLDELLRGPDRQRYNEDMGSGSSMTKERSREATLTIPHEIAEAAERMSKDHHWTFEKALLVLLKRGLSAQRAAEQDIENKYETFLRETDGDRAEKAGDDLIRAVFGADAIA